MVARPLNFWRLSSRVVSLNSLSPVTATRDVALPLVSFSEWCDAPKFPREDQNWTLPSAIANL
jgi:hypothetical protein